MSEGPLRTPDDGNIKNGNTVAVMFETSVDPYRMDRGTVVDDNPVNAVLVVDTLRAGKPILHIHADNSVSIESPNTDTLIEDFGSKASITRLEK